MNIVVATDIHPPYDQRIIKEIKSLSKIGQVIYISPPGDPGIDVEHIELPRYSSKRERLFKGPKDVYKITLRINPDFFHFHDPELIPIGVKLSKKGIRVVYDVHENYPAAAYRKYKNMRWFLPKILEKYELYASKHFYGVVAVVESICERLSKVTKCALVPNYPDFELFRGIEKTRRNDGKVRFVYTGSIGEDRAIIEMLEAFKILGKKYNNVEFVMIGPINSKAIIEYLKDYKVKGFFYKKPVPREEALRITASSDVGMLVYHITPASIQSSPNKIFEYMYFNLPVVASNIEYWKKFLRNCAVYVDPKDIESIVRGMEEAMKMVGKIDCRSIVKNYSWDFCEKKLLELYKGM